METYYHVPINSKIAKSFDLLNTFKIPRPCAFYSVNNTSAAYYRGQNALAVNIDKTIIQYLQNPELILIDGSNADPIAKWNKSSNQILVQTNNENDVGVN